MEPILAITNLSFGQSEYPAPGLSAQQAAEAHAAAIGGTAQCLSAAPPIWRVDAAARPSYLVAAEDLKLRVLRGRRLSALKLVFTGGCRASIVRFNQMSGQLRRGGVRLELLNAHPLRQTIANRPSRSR